MQAGIGIQIKAAAVETGNIARHSCVNDLGLGIAPVQIAAAQAHCAVLPERGATHGQWFVGNIVKPAAVPGAVRMEAGVADPQGAVRSVVEAAAVYSGGVRGKAHLLEDKVAAALIINSAPVGSCSIIREYHICEGNYEATVEYTTAIV